MWEAIFTQNYVLCCDTIMFELMSNYIETVTLYDILHCLVWQSVLAYSVNECCRQVVAPLTIHRHLVQQTPDVLGYQTVLILEQ